MWISQLFLLPTWWFLIWQVKSAITWHVSRIILQFCGNVIYLPTNLCISVTVILFIFLFSYFNFLIKCCSSELCHLSTINQSMVHRSHSGAYTPLKDEFACPLSCTFHISPSFSPGVWKCVFVALHPQWIRLWSTAWQLSGLKRNTRLDSIMSVVQTVWMCLLLKGQPSLAAQYDMCDMTGCIFPRLSVINGALFPHWE